MSYNPNNTGTPKISRSSGPSATNNSGGTLGKGTPVKLNSSGLSGIDISSEADADCVAGIVRANIANGVAGDLVSNGILEDITTSIAVGSAVFVGTDGELTDVKPSRGVGDYSAGDWVIFVGVIVKNAGDPSKKDLLVNIQIRGVL